MYLRIGSFQFSPGEAYPAFFGQRRIYNQRGRAQSVIKRIQVQGEIIAASQAAITTRCGQILQQLSVDGATVAFVQDNGTDTHIKLDSATSFGVRVVEHTLSMEEAKAHYATGLPFTAAFEAEYPASDLDPYTLYEETITKIGNGGPRTVVQELDSGQCIEQIVSTNTPVTMVQQGVAIGYADYPPFPVMIYGTDNPEGTESFGTPEVNAAGYINWPIRWSYRKTLTTSPALVPPNFPG